jgi:hypothetical protein
VLFVKTAASERLLCALVDFRLAFVTGTAGYFLSLADVLSSGQLVVKQEWLAKILCLVLYEIGNPDQVAAHGSR